MKNLSEYTASEKIDLIRSWYEEEVPENFNIEFVDSVEDSYIEHGSITDKQDIALNRIILAWIWKE